MPRTWSDWPPPLTCSATREYLALLERAHGAHLDANDPLRAVRCAFWVETHFAQRGEMAQAGGWLGRAKRLLERCGPDAVECGYLLLPSVFEHEARGELELAARVAGEAVTIAERFGDRDLLALGAHMQGHMLIEAGHLAGGVALLDEAMVPAAGGELSPIVTGIVYCGVILACQSAHEVRRAREWTEVLSRWCERQPDLVACTGRCLIHRAEIMQLGGSWSTALEEARRAHQRCLQGRNEAAAGEASYRESEVRRLRGEHPAAESAYRDASRRGREPQPGLALLGVAQGDRDSAMNLIRRALAETDQPAVVGRKRRLMTPIGGAVACPPFRTAARPLLGRRIECCRYRIAWAAAFGLVDQRVFPAAVR